MVSVPTGFAFEVLVPPFQAASLPIARELP
jgi:hypothetical protein